jgi:hypothetical protein
MMFYTITLINLVVSRFRQNLLQIINETELNWTLLKCYLQFSVVNLGVRVVCASSNVVLSS